MKDTCDKRHISPPATPLQEIEGCSVGGNLVPIQSLLSPISDSSRVCRCRAWRCLVMEKRAGHEWVVVCSDDAIPNDEHGWICDCGKWTFGNDAGHVPVSEHTAVVREHHDARNKRRQARKVQRSRE